MLHVLVQQPSGARGLTFGLSFQILSLLLFLVVHAILVMIASSRNQCLNEPMYHRSLARVLRVIYNAIQPRSTVGNVSATDACLTADPGVASSIPVRSHIFVEIDHEIISRVILLPSADLFKKDCCQLQAKVCARITG